MTEEVGDLLRVGSSIAVPGYHLQKKVDFYFPTNGCESQLRLSGNRQNECPKSRFKSGMHIILIALIDVTKQPFAFYTRC